MQDEQETATVQGSDLAPTELKEADKMLPAQSGEGNAPKPAARADDRSLDPNQLIALVIERGGTMEQLEKMMDFQRRWEANEARKSFNNAMADFSANPIFIVKNKHVSYDSGKGRVDYNHASLDEIANKVARSMAPHGLSFRWRTNNEASPLSVTCIVSHRDGHREETTLFGPLDKSGSKNDIQAIGSAVTYLERYTLKAALGLAESDDDDDGRSVDREQPAERAQGGGGPITDEQAMTIEAALDQSGVTTNALMLKLRRITPDNHKPENILSIPSALYTDALAIAEGKQR